jgi:hypothetical protein
MNVTCRAWVRRRQKRRRFCIRSPYLRLARRDLATNTERVLQSDLVSDLIHLEVSSQTTSALVHAISEGTSDDGGSFAVDNLTLTEGGHDG